MLRMPRGEHVRRTFSAAFGTRSVPYFRLSLLRAIVVPRTSESSVDEAKIARVRREIAAGTYETPQKLEAAVAAMLEGWDESDEDDSAGPRRCAK